MLRSARCQSWAVIRVRSCEFDAHAAGTKAVGRVCSEIMAPRSCSVYGIPFESMSMSVKSRP